MNSSTSFVKVNIDNVKKLAGNGQTVFALKNDGTVYTWGKRIYDGKAWQYDVAEPSIIFDVDGEPFKNVVDISSEGITFEWRNGGIPGLSMITLEDGMANGYQVGNQWGGVTFEEPNVRKYFSVPVSATSDIKNPVHAFSGDDVLGFVVDGSFYTKTENPFVPPVSVNKIVKAWKQGTTTIYLSESGAIYINGVIQDLDIGIKLTAKKNTQEKYDSEEKYNDTVDISVSTNNGNGIACTIENPIGSNAVSCPDFTNNEIHLIANNTRLYQKYNFTDTVNSRQFIVDLYKGEPQLANYSSSITNKIKITDVISISVPSDQADWNSYNATITDSANQTSIFTGGTLSAGSYTIHVTDAYGNTQDYQFEVIDKPEPTAVFTPSSLNLVYKDSYTKINGTVGTFSLQYPTGEPTSTIASIRHKW